METFVYDAGVVIVGIFRVKLDRPHTSHLEKEKVKCDGNVSLAINFKKKTSLDCAVVVVCKRYYDRCKITICCCTPPTDEHAVSSTDTVRNARARAGPSSPAHESAQMALPSNRSDVLASSPALSPRELGMGVSARVFSCDGPNKHHHRAAVAVFRTKTTYVFYVFPETCIRPRHLPVDGKTDRHECRPKRLSMITD